jgi:hypothetical protein
MNKREGQIEVAIGVEINAGIAFWVDKTQWDGMDEAARRTMVDKAIEQAAIRFCEEPVQLDNKLTLSAEILGPEGEGIKMDELQIYDPEAWE